MSSLAPDRSGVPAQAGTQGHWAPACAGAQEGADGLIVQLPPAPGGTAHWWRVDDGRIAHDGSFGADDAAPWGELEDGARIVALAPAALAPVTDRPMPAMPVAQALAAERLDLAGQGVGSAPRHVAVAESGGRLLACAVAKGDMDAWLAVCASLGFDPDALVPAALVLPRPASGVSGAWLGEEPLARTSSAAFAGEPALIEALAGEGETHEIAGDALAGALLGAFAAPPLDLRQGAYAPRRAAWFHLPDWTKLARMAAIAALLWLALMLVWIVRWNADSSAREAEALAAAQSRFPAATDLDSAERLASAELAKRGLGGAGFSAPTAALLAAMRPVPGVSLRDLGFAADGTLRFTASAPRAEDINAVLLTLQQGGWKVTVPPTLAPDPTGATVAAITVRAP
ncbi:MAG: hypothetical protein KGL48_09040 [Sphingomonadales bacterium]|nr:hypothetical protein [Sphingomonadales bacterium]MDE2568139.1 hypothetical protein [Sphingomonadales bacterium]